MTATPTDPTQASDGTPAATPGRRDARAWRDARGRLVLQACGGDGDGASADVARMRFTMRADGGIERIDARGVMVNLFAACIGGAGPANLWLCVGSGDADADADAEVHALLGAASPLAFDVGADGASVVGHGRLGALTLTLRLDAVDAGAAGGPGTADAAGALAAWCWRLRVRGGEGPAPRAVRLVAVQDVGLCEPAAAALNEHYVSHYVDLLPIDHPDAGVVIAARQNQPMRSRHPWAAFGSLRRGRGFATDLLQLARVGGRAGEPDAALRRPLASVRLQHEHALAAIDDGWTRLADLGDGGAPGADVGAFGVFVAHHPDASGPHDAATIDAARRWAAALPPIDAGDDAPPGGRAPRPPQAWPSLFTTSAWLEVRDGDDADLAAWFGGERRHAEWIDGALASFFLGEGDGRAHVVLRAKERAAMRPHGRLLRAGHHIVPDEAALTSTVWMAGVFHSMLTQGHVAINRLLSTQRGWLGTFRHAGLRIFVRPSPAVVEAVGTVGAGAGAPDAAAARWRQLGVPSAFEMRRDASIWHYRHAGGVLRVRSAAGVRADAVSVEVEVADGAPVELLLTHHLALGDDGPGAEPAPVRWRRDGEAMVVAVPERGPLAQRFAGDALRLEPIEPGGFAAAGVEVGDDGMLFADGRPRGEPFVCLRSAAVRRLGVRLVGRLLDASPAPPQVQVDASDPLPRAPALEVPAGSGAARDAARQLGEALPWFVDDALVHLLSPRGLEQYSGGGWGTRDVCQGPLELLLALGRVAPARDLLRRVFEAQDPGGDWPQWFMFFERERALRAPDSHGDIVLWPLLGLARYLEASGDRAFLDAPVAWHDAPAAPLAEHVDRALALVRRRRIAGTSLVAYGHGDWNDSLQPADPALRERLCSAWTVTLHHQVLLALADALDGLGRAGAAALREEAAAVRADFQRHLVADGVVAGYALFAPATAAGGGAGARVEELLLHPRDRLTGLRASLLPMVHGALAGLFDDAQARAHDALVRDELTALDGARLFDRPLPYRGGVTTLFQRAESSAFFGREIGLMYMHAHLRRAEQLALLGDAPGLLDALGLAHAVGLSTRLKEARPRQANCYHSSSDAAFDDRLHAERDYRRVHDGGVAFEGGWRVYSSGPGIAVAIVVERLLGLRAQHRRLVVDPVVPPALDGLGARLAIGPRRLRLRLHVGPRGCGVARLAVDGADVPFAPLDDPHRPAGAALEWRHLDAALAREAMLEVWLR